MSTPNTSTVPAIPVFKILPATPNLDQNLDIGDEFGLADEVVGNNESEGAVTWPNTYRTLLEVMSLVAESEI